VRTRFVWMDGTLVEADRAVVPFLTAGLHYGAAVFEGIRCYETAEGPAILRLTAHVERLLASARILGFRDLPYTTADLTAATRETVAANGFGACYIRPVLYLADGGWNLTVDSGRPRVGIAVWEWADYLGPAARAEGIRANVSSYTRHHPNVTMTKAKIAGNYASSILAKTESLRLGFDEAIMLDPQGCVAECTGENLFVVRGGRIATPPAAAILEGFTREMLIELARDAGYAVREAPVSRDQLYAADEVFVCGTAAEVVGLREIDFRTIGAGRTGPVTHALQEAFEAVTRGRHPRSADWLEPVGSAAPEPSGQVAAS
jgi:branched-chain amino acid aminotransferase